MSACISNHLIKRSSSMPKFTETAVVVSLRVLAVALCLSISSFVAMAPYAVYGLYLKPAIQAKADNLEISKAKELAGVVGGNFNQE